MDIINKLQAYKEELSQETENNYHKGSKKGKVFDKIDELIKEIVEFGEM